MRVQTIFTQIGERLHRLIVPADPLLRGTSVSRQMWAALSVGPWGSAVVVALLAFSAYLDCTELQYAPADQQAIVENPVARGETTLETVFRAPTAEDGTGLIAYQPVALLSQRLDQALAPNDPLFAHRVSALIHALNALLLLAVLRQLSSNHWLGRAVACLFAVHPLGASSVAYLAERGQLLATFGVLASLHCMIRGRAGPGAVAADAPRSTAAPGLQALALVGRAAGPLLGLATGAFALFAAESALVLPVLLAAYLLAFEPGAGFRRWLIVLAHLVLAGLYLAARWNALHGWGIPPLPDLPPLDHLLALLRHLGAMLRVVLLPFEVSWAKSLAVTRSLWTLAFLGMGGLGILAALALLAFQRRRLPWAWFGLVWVLVPATVMVELSVRTGTVAETWWYLPSIGLWLAAVTLVIAALQNRRWGLMLLRTAAVAGGILVLILGLRTNSRLNDWRGRSAPLELTLRATARAARFHYLVALALLQSEEPKQAVEQLRTTVAIQPEHVPARIKLGLTLGQLGEREEALSLIRGVLRDRPDDAELLLFVGKMLVAKRSYRAGLRYLRRAAETGLPTAETCNRLAWVLATCPDPALRNGREAVDWAQRTVKLAGEDDARALDTLAAAYAELGNFLKATQLATKASQLAAKQGSYTLSAAILDRVKLYNKRYPYREE